jgi:arylsulfatase A
MLLLLILLTCFEFALAVPNFILIVADDLGYNDITSYGSPTIMTPNLDMLAREGLKFTQFYTPGPLCTPSRGAMLTGRLPIKSGLYTNFDYPLDNVFRVFYPSSVGCLPLNETTVAEYLRSSPAKYSTAMIGKWHLGHNPEIGCLPTFRGFDYFYGLPYSHEEGYPGPFPESLFFPPVPLFNGDQIVEQPVNLTSLTVRYTDRILKLIDQWAATGQPFFLHAAYEQPHIPLFASKNTSRRGLYGDAVEEMDASIGQIINKLRENGLDLNTLVLFASDNGAWINPNNGFPTDPSQPLDGGSNAPFYDGKGSTWEGGIRVPLIAWWPNTIKPNVTFEVASMLDILPTFLELAGIPQPSNVTLDGYSLVPMIYGKNYTSPYTFLYFWRENVLYAIRYGPWKAHYYTRSGFGTEPPTKYDPPLLFNVEYDAGERYPFNVSDYPQIYSIINEEYNRVNSTTVKGVQQYDWQNFTIMPCCDGPFNLSDFLRFMKQGNYSLAMWDALGCVCMNEN